MDINDTVTWDDDTTVFPQVMTILDIDDFGFNYKVRYVSGREVWVDSAEVRPF